MIEDWGLEGTSLASLIWPPGKDPVLRSDGGEGLCPAGRLCGSLGKIMHTKQSRYAGCQASFLERTFPAASLWDDYSSVFLPALLQKCSHVTSKSP